MKSALLLVVGTAALILTGCTTVPTASPTTTPSAIPSVALDACQKAATSLPISPNDYDFANPESQLRHGVAHTNGEEYWLLTYRVISQPDSPAAINCVFSRGSAEIVSDETLVSWG